MLYTRTHGAGPSLRRHPNDAPVHMPAVPGQLSQKFVWSIKLDYGHQ